MKIVLKLTKILLLISWVGNFANYLYWVFNPSYNENFADYFYVGKPILWHSVFIIIFTSGIVLMLKKINNAISNFSEFKTTYNLLEPWWLKGLNLGTRRIFSIIYIPVSGYMLLYCLITPILIINESKYGYLFEKLSIEENFKLAVVAVIMFLGLFIINLIVSLLIKLFNWIKIGFSSKHPLGHETEHHN